jgi:uncharacterized protein (TIGR03435 family)
MLGPMMQTLLEDKVKLRVHRESRDSAAYAIVPAAGTPILHPFVEGSCTPYDPSKPLPPGAPPNGIKGCDFFVGVTPSKGNIPSAAAGGATMSDFANLLSLAVDRPVIDATGIAGRFDFHLEYAIDENTPRMLAMSRELPEFGTGGARPTILTAIQEQLGLKLVPTRAPREFLVIDHVERPSAF